MSALDSPEALARFGRARVARMATVDPGGRPHLVPVVFALVDGHIVSAVDHKPKTTTRLARIANIERNPAVSLLVDHYADDWSRLWWVRVDGTASVMPDTPDRMRQLGALAAKYEQYAAQLPDGPVIHIAIERVVGWQASDGVDQEGTAAHG